MITIILIEVARLILTGMCLGLGFAIIRAFEDWLQGKRLMMNEEFMKQVAKA